MEAFSGILGATVQYLKKQLPSYLPVRVTRDVEKRESQGTTRFSSFSASTDSLISGGCPTAGQGHRGHSNKTCFTCLLFWGFSNVCHSAAFWPTALKLGCITNFDMLFLVMGLISLVYEIQFMLISSRHICIRSIKYNLCHKNLGRVFIVK